MDPDKSIFQFNCQNWFRMAGLPTGKIWTIAQDKEGYIWISTQKGPFRFDGREFKQYPIYPSADKPHSSDRPPPSGNGASDAPVVGESTGAWDRQAFAALASAQFIGFKEPSHPFLAASDGVLWFGSADGWTRKLGDQAIDTDNQDAHGPVTSLYEDRENRVWIGTAGHGVFYWSGGRANSFPDPELQRLTILSVAEDRSGGIWVATPQGLYCYDPQFRRKEVVLRGVQTNALLSDSRGVIWAATNGIGLVRFEDGVSATLRKADGLANDEVTTVFEDAEGSLWAGTADGLSQLTDVKFPVFTDKEGLITGASLAVSASRQGGIWLATIGGATHFDGKTAVNFRALARFPDTYLRRIFEARNGDIYVSDGLRNIATLSGARVSAVYPSNIWPEAFAEDDISVLASVGPDIYRIKEGKLEPYSFEGTPPLLNWVNGLCVARNGTIWAGTNNGLFRIKDGTFRQWTAAKGLLSGQVNFVMEDFEGVIWAGSPEGLVRIKDDTLATIGAKAGLPDARIFAIVPDNLGNFWLDSGSGFLRVARKSLMDFADGKLPSIELETFNGLGSVKFNDRSDQAFSGCRSSDGRIWFPNPHGVAMIDPAHFFVNRVPPLVSILKNFKGRQGDSGRPRARARADPNGVEFVFSALSFVNPEKMRVRYKLQGMDPSWVEAGTGRSVSYTSLKPGEYTFIVQAANADGVWNLVGDRIDIEIPVPFYQRLWFYALIALLAALAVYWLYGWKARQALARQRELESQNNLLEAKVARRTDELAKSLSLLKATLDSAPDGILAIQTSDDSASWNSQFVEMWGIPSDVLRQYSGTQIIERIAAMARDGTDFADRINASKATPDSELFVVMALKDGRTLELHCKPQQLNGTIAGMVLNFRDVTERVRIEEALRASEKRFKAMFEQAAVGVAQVDIESGHFVQINRRFCEIMGRSEAEMRQLTFATIIQVNDLERHKSKMENLRTGATRESSREGRFLKKDGTEVWLNLTMSAMWAPGEKPDYVIVVAEDSTNRKRLEEQFRESQKMEAIGTLAGGIAHDFNNILTIINGYTELALMDLPPKSPVKEHLDTVRLAVKRASDLVGQILTFSRQQPLERKAMLLLPIVNEAVKMLRATIPSTIVFRISLAGDTPMVFADATQIHQILMNLGTNAWHAMKNRTGRLDITLERCVVGPAFASMMPKLNAGVYARLSVGDTGCGMDQTTLRRIFEPFFTTKPPGEGTGLGLAVVHGIMDDHDGVIAAFSRPGEGTNFQLYFPEYIGGEIPAEGREGQLTRGRGERILIVDDEHMLVLLGQTALNALGYRVETATTPEAALEMIRADSHRFSLVILDQAMPGMSGLALATQMHKVQPTLPIIMMTGNNLALTPEMIAQAGISRVLLKPASLQILGALAREVIDGPH
ncbi:MAG TPA: two-component regulator propeller domain-containing protein [Opitutaceae bacterium]